MRRRVGASPKMRIELVGLAELHRWPKNPRAHNDQASLGDSFGRFGFVDPIIVDEGTGRIVAGHGRLEKLEELYLARATPPGRVEVGPGGEWLIPVLRGIQFANEREAEAYLLACNRIGDNSGWNEEDLAVMLAHHTDNVVGIGWSEEEILALVDDPPTELAAPESDEELVEPEMPAEPPKVPVTKPGDIWVLDRHRLVCGDCRDAGDVQRAVWGAPINIAFTSPPYASQRKYDDASGFEPIAPDAYVDWFQAVQSNVRSVLAPDGSWFVNIKEHCDDGERSLYVKDLTIAHVRRWGWRFVDELCWVHHGFPGAVVDRFRNAWEPVFHFALTAPAKCRPQHVAYESKFVMQYEKDARQTISGAGWQGAHEPARAAGLAFPRNVLQLTNGSSSSSIKGHSASFPVHLPSFFIRAYTDKGDVVLDPFMGSGTVIMAAEQLDRRAIGVELSPAYCDVIIERWEHLTGKKAERVSGKRSRVANSHSQAAALRSDV